MQDITRDMLTRAQKGDMEAFEEIYKASSDFIYNVTYRVMNNAEDAEEVTQDVFIKIYKNLKNFRFQSSFKTWAYRIAINTAINGYKKKAKELNRRSSYNDGIESQYTQEKTRESADRGNHEMLIKSLLSTLNPDQRACVILKDIEGLRYKDIAKVLNINLNTVRSRLKRARETLLALKQKGVISNGL
jgi:RNA polymerase sigma-70 factor (ECF subfamily)